MARLAFALLVLGALVDARLTKPRGLDDKELTALAQLSDKAEEESVKEESLQDETQDKDEDELLHEPVGAHASAHETPASKEGKNAEKAEAKKDTDPHHQGQVKVVPEPQKPEPESTRVDVKVHSSDPLPDDEKVDVTVIVNDTKATKTTLPPKPAVSIDINTKEVVVSDVPETTTTTIRNAASSPAVLSMLIGVLSFAIWSF
mmetsp:Transcript_24298/g.28635  ORF Transcript_24298/g.28635 Transcript_24298/m.28635 type:complete len:203 (-) Transcript_24298:31-639(-)|eukprot:Skav228299  [mRNA]  locus=scaffold209:285745:290022:- [translate_table: standard]